MAVTQKELCANCERAIGKLESAFVWHDSVVYRECYQKLNVSSKGRGSAMRFIAIGFIVTLLAGGAAGGAWWWMTQNGAHELHDAPAADAPKRGGLPSNGAPADGKVPAAGNVIQNMLTTKGTIQGGAWIVRKSGESTLLRGLEVALVKEGEVRGVDVKRICSPCLQRLRNEIADTRKNLAEEISSNDARERQFPGSQRITVMEDHYKKTLNELNDLLKDRESLVAAVPASVPITDAYLTLKKANSYFGVPPATELIRPFVVTTTHADFEGKFSFRDVPKGNYLLFADFSTSSSAIQWLVPVEIESSGEIHCDLYNENAATIEN